MVRLRKKPWIPEAIKQYDRYIPNAQPGGNWREVFGRKALLYVEIGTGRGRFICELATRYPQVNFIGIETQIDILFDAARKVDEMQLTNLRLLHFDANQISDIFANGQIDRLYINFCDPWPKNRHAKRRLTHRLFLEKYRVSLSRCGELFFKTDNQSLFEFSLTQFYDAGLEVRNITFDLHNDDVADNIMTEYEAKFSAKGMKICRCEVIFPNG
jgi:tRNA (guanine-N7-)-methyltransferase